MENQEKQIKTIGMGFVGKFFGWAIGIIFILLGFMVLYRGFASGLIGKLFLSSILFILSGFILLPVFNLFLIKFQIQLKPTFSISSKPTTDFKHAYSNLKTAMQTLGYNLSEL